MFIWLVAFLLLASVGAFAIGYLPSRRTRRVAIGIWSAAPVLVWVAFGAEEFSAVSILMPMVLSLFYAIPWAVASLIGYSWKRELVQRRSET